MEQFTSFVQEALEFLSLLRASEKERFESQKKFMSETTKILKDLAESILTNNTVIKNALEDLKVSLNDEVKKISESIGLDNLMQAINALEDSVDLLQRGSTILDYKFTVQKTREILDELQKKKSQIEIGASAGRGGPSLSSGAPVGVSPPKIGPPSEAVAAPEKPPKKSKPSPPPAPSKAKPSKKSAAPAKGKTPKSKEASGKSPEKAETPGQAGTPKFDPLASAMGTRTQAPRRVVNLKKTKIVDANGGPVQIDTGTDEEK